MARHATAFDLHTAARRSLGVALCAGLLLRVWLNVRANWLIDGDEAMFGIAAIQILHGAHPIFLYGVPYMGMIQSYVAAPFVWLLGPTPTALRLVTLLGSAAYITVTWRLAMAWYGPAVAAVAVWFAAVPSVYFDATSLKVWGSYVGIMALGGLIVLGVWQCRIGCGHLSKPWWLLIGFCAGLSIWANLLIVYYLITAALLFPWRRIAIWLPSATLWGLPGLAVGGLPFWYFNVRHHFATLTFVFGGAGSHDPEYLPVASELFRVLLPRVVGLSSPWSPMPHALAILLATILVAALVLSVAESVRRIIGSQREATDTARHPLPALVFLAVLLIVYLASGFGRPSLSPFDASGRYLLPLWSVVPMLLARLILTASRWWLPLGALFAGLALGCLLVAYVTSDARLVFQSPYWQNLPEDNQSLLRWLRAQHVDAVWMNHWAGDPLIYTSGNTIRAADYYDIVVGHGINRFPALFTAVANSPRAAYVVVAPGQVHPPIEAAMNRLGVRYERATIGPYQIFLPLSRHVAPEEVVEGLRYPY